MECACFYKLCYCSGRDEPTFKVLPAAETVVEDLFSSSKPKAPYFTQKPSAAGVKEGHPVRFECVLQPVGDPNMIVEWYCNGELVKVGKLVSN